MLLLHANSTTAIKPSHSQQSPCLRCSSAQIVVGGINKGPLLTHTCIHSVAIAQCGALSSSSSSVSPSDGDNARKQPGSKSAPAPKPPLAASSSSAAKQARQVVLSQRQQASKAPKKTGHEQQHEQDRETASVAAPSPAAASSNANSKPAAVKPQQKRLQAPQQQQQKKQTTNAPQASPTTPAAPSANTNTSTSSSARSKQKPRFTIRTRSNDPFTNVRFKTFGQLQHLVAAHGSSARIAALTATMSRLKTAESRSNADKVLLLQQLWGHLLPQLPHAAARHCAEVMLTASKLGQAPEGLYDDCMRQLVRQVQGAEAATVEMRILSNAIYAVGTASPDSYSPETRQQLQGVLLPAFLRTLSADGNSQSVSNVCYALGLLGYSGAQQQLQQVLLAVDPGIWSHARGQELSTTIWAAGQLGAQLPPPQQAAIVAAIVAGAAAQAVTAQDIANTMHGLALLQQQLDPKQHAVLTAALLQKQPDPQAISGFLWSSAKMGLVLTSPQAGALITQLLRCAQQHNTSSSPTASSGSSSSQQQQRQLVPQAISMALWAVASMECSSIAPASLLRLLQLLAAAPPNSSASSSQHGQAVSMGLWAAAKLKLEVPTAVLDKLFQQLAAVLPDAEPQSICNSLWAAAVMLPQPYVPTAILGRWTEQQQQQEGVRQKQQQGQQQQKQAQGRQQQVAGKKKGTRRQEQQAAAAVDPIAVIVSRVPDMKPGELSNLALALALMNVRCMDILRPLYDAAVKHARELKGDSSSSSGSGGGGVAVDAANSSSSKKKGGSTDSSSSSSSRAAAAAALTSTSATTSHHIMGPQALSNLLWAGAVLGLHEQQQHLLLLAEACIDTWQPASGADGSAADGGDGISTTAAAAAANTLSPSAEETMQLYQVHLWLTEQLGTQGLRGLLTRQQLQQCRDSMRRVVAQMARPSQLQQQVYEAAMLVPELQGVQLEAVTDDGLLSVDVSAQLVAMGGGGDGDGGGSGHVATEQQRVAIEVDGPWHWLRPFHSQPTGPTCFRNQLLARRGFVVVTVAYWEWECRRGDREAQVAWLRAAVLDAAVAAGC